MKKTILILLIALGVIGCDPYVSYYLYIDNRSEDTIKIVFLEKSPYLMINPDSLVFYPNSKKMLWGAEGTPSRDGCSYTGINKDEVEFVISSNKKLKKEIWNIKNWNCSGSYNNGWTKTFTINEEDLE